MSIALSLFVVVVVVLGGNMSVGDLTMGGVVIQLWITPQRGRKEWLKKHGLALTDRLQRL